MHHTLLIKHVLRVCGHVDDHWLVLGQRCLEVGFLPLELFEVIRPVHFGTRRVLTVPSRKAEILQVHVFDEIKLPILRTVVNLVRMGRVFWRQRNKLEDFREGIVVPTEESVLFTS